MKKLLTILSALTLISGTTTSILACGGKHENNDTPGDSYSQDAKILNDIVNEINKYFLDFLNSSQVINSSEYGTVFDNFFGKVDESNPTAILDPNDSDVSQGIEDINSIFKSYLNQINIKIAQEYSNVYVNTYPVTWNLEQNTSTLGYIDLTELSSLNPSVDITGLKAVRYQLNINYGISYKELSAVNEFTFDFIVTNSPEKINKLQSESIAKLSGDIVKYFTQGNIIIDQNTAYKKLYDDFNINYSRSHIDLDNIVQTELVNFLKADPELTDLMDHVSYNDNQSILSLLSGALNDVTSGKAVPSLPKNTAYVWAGEGPFDANKVTPEVFYNFLINLLQVFNISDNVLQLASFNVNLAKINIAGMPLSGVATQSGKPLTVTIAISKEGLRQKLLNYANIVVTFFKEYRIEVYKDHQIIHVPSVVFDEMQSASNYPNSLPFLLNNFLELENVKTLDDIGLFYLDDATQANKQNRPGTWTTINENQLKYKDGGHGYSFSFMFGDHTFDNSISYSPWSNVYLPNLYVNRN